MTRYTTGTPQRPNIARGPPVVAGGPPVALPPSVLQVRPAAVHFSAWLVLPGCGAYKPRVLYGWLWVVRDRLCFYCCQFPTSHVVN